MCQLLQNSLKYSTVWQGSKKARKVEIKLEFKMLGETIIWNARAFEISMKNTCIIGSYAFLQKSHVQSD